jgi:hypothetical protein
VLGGKCARGDREHSEHSRDHDNSFLQGRSFLVPGDWSRRSDEHRSAWCLDAALAVF